MLAEVHLSMHDFEKALDHGSKAFQLNPNDPRVSSVYGEILIRIEKLDEGISLLEKAYELDPIPQGQSTSDRRICALLTGYYLSNNLQRCEELINEIVEIDFKSWLLSIDIFNHNNKDVEDQTWFTKGITKFNDLDLILEVDRFHLNNKDLSENLVNKAQSILVN